MNLYCAHTEHETPRQILTFCCAIFFLGVTCPSGFCAAEGESFRYDPRFYESRIYWENFSIFQKFSLWIYSIFCQNAVQATFLVNRSNEHTILFPGWDVTDIYIVGDSSNFEFMKVSTFFFCWQVWRGILNVNFVNKKGAKSWVKCH